MRGLAAIGIVALLTVAVAVAAPDGRAPGEGARPAASLASGSFAQSNSRGGLPIFTAANLGPGDSTTGSVTITNSGTVGGAFTLSALDLSDAPGPNGGPLSRRLRMAVQDVTAPATPAVVYSGSLAAMTPRPLGGFDPGEARDYRFTATLPEGGGPRSPTDGDNAYAGSSTIVRFRWGATASLPPAAPPSGEPARVAPRPAVGDRRPPRLQLTIPHVQRVLSRGYLVVRARCSEPCRLGVTGRIRAGRARTRKTRSIHGRRGVPGRTTFLRVRIPGKLRTKVRGALLVGGAVTVRLTVTARDRAGNRAVARRTVRLRRH